MFGDLPICGKLYGRLIESGEIHENTGALTTQLSEKKSELVVNKKA